MIKKFIIIYFLLVSMVLSDECYYENKTTSKNGVIIEEIETKVFEIIKDHYEKI